MQFVPFSSRLKPKVDPATAPSGQSLPSAAAPESSAASNEQASERHAPIVNLKRDGDKVTRIEIQCSCGELIALDCSY